VKAAARAAGRMRFVIFIVVLPENVRLS